jgi:hypothetical protein
MICRWVRARLRAPITGSTGRVPKTRVSCPMPWRARSSRSIEASTKSCWCGAISPPESMPTQTP